MTTRENSSSSSASVRLGSLASQWREKAEAMKREADEQRDHERRVYCDGKAIALKYTADDLDAALTALRTQLEQLEQEMRDVLDGSLAAPTDDYIEKWATALADLLGNQKG